MAEDLPSFLLIFPYADSKIIDPCKVAPQKDS